MKDWLSLIILLKELEPIFSILNASCLIIPNISFNKTQNMKA